MANPIVYTNSDGAMLYVKNDPLILAADSNDFFSEDYISNLTYKLVNNQIFLSWEADGDFTYIIIDGNLLEVTTEEIYYISAGQKFIELFSSDLNTENWNLLKKYVPKKSFTLIWYQVSGATKYNIYLDNVIIDTISEDGQSLYSYSTPKLSDTSVASVYTLGIKSVNADGDESSIESATFHVVSYPQYPSSLSKSQPLGSNTATITWTGITF